MLRNLYKAFSAYLALILLPVSNSFQQQLVCPAHCRLRREQNLCELVTLVCLTRSLHIVQATPTLLEASNILHRPRPRTLKHEKPAKYVVSKCFIVYHVSYSQAHACTLSSGSQSLLSWRYGDVALLPTSRGTQSPGECERAESLHYLFIAQKKIYGNNLNNTRF